MGKKNQGTDDGSLVLKLKFTYKQYIWIWVVLYYNQLDKFEFDGM